MVVDADHDQRADVWSLVVLMYEFLVGSPPFEDTSKRATYRKIRSAQVSFPPRLAVSPDAVDLIGRMIQANPDNRIPLQRVLTHPWIRQHSDPDGRKRCLERYGGD